MKSGRARKAISDSVPVAELSRAWRDIGASVQQGDLLAHLNEQNFLNKRRSAEADVASAEPVIVESQATEIRQSQRWKKL
ncbi:MAG: hypothetical protein ABL893_19075 [Hyphomicrobium sp.]